jgi:hypothetical protein
VVQQNQTAEVAGVAAPTGRETALSADHRHSLQRESREAREAWLREVMQNMREQEEQAIRTREAVKAIFLDEVFLTLQEIARILAMSANGVNRMLKQEPGVPVIRPPAPKRAIVRVPVSVVERIIKRHTILPPRTR